MTRATIGLAAEAAWLAGTGQPAAAVPLAAAAIYLGHIVGLSTRVWWRPWPSRQPGTLTTTPDGTTGVRFRYSSWSYYWVIRTGWLAGDPTLVYHTLSFYHAHPELRTELATPQALRRIGTR